jgi:hypothetical protein
MYAAKAVCKLHPQPAVAENSNGSRYDMWIAAANTAAEGTDFPAALLFPIKSACLDVALPITNFSLTCCPLLLFCILY